MSRAARVYQEKLSELDYGTPLWRPEPSPFEVQIGDVGRIDPSSGCWDRFFNILYPASDPLNSQGVPHNFKPLRRDITSTRQLRRQLQPSVYSSSSVRAIDIEGEISTAGMGFASAACQYECVKESGALLALQSDGDQEISISTKGWIDYMAQNHEDWHQWAQRNRHEDIGKREIILVFGWIKARDWYVASFASKDTALRLSLAGGIPYGDVRTTIAVHSRHIISPERRQSLTFRTAPYDESNPIQHHAQETTTQDCIFLNTFRMKKHDRVMHALSSLISVFSKGKVEGHDSDQSSSMHRSSLSGLTGDSASRDGSSVWSRSSGYVDSDVVASEREQLVPTADPEYPEVKLPVDRLLNHLLEATGADVAIAPDIFIHPTTGKPIQYSHLDDEALRELFPCTVTPGGVATVDLEEFQQAHFSQAQASASPHVSTSPVPSENERLSDSGRLENLDLTRVTPPLSLQGHDAPRARSVSSSCDSLLEHDLAARDSSRSSYRSVPGNQRLMQEVQQIGETMPQIEKAYGKVRSRIEATIGIPGTERNNTSAMEILLEKWVQVKETVTDILWESIYVSRVICDITGELQLTGHIRKYTGDNQQIPEEDSKVYKEYIQRLDDDKIKSQELVESFSNLQRSIKDVVNDVRKKRPANLAGSVCDYDLNIFLAFSSDVQDYHTVEDDGSQSDTSMVSSDLLEKRTSRSQRSRPSRSHEDIDLSREQDKSSSSSDNRDTKLLEAFFRESTEELSAVYDGMRHFKVLWGEIQADLNNIKSTLRNISHMTFRTEERMRRITALCHDLSDALEVYQTILDDRSELFR